MIDEQLKHRFQRCLEILNALLSGESFNRKVLSQRHTCSVRTIAKDLQLLRDVGFNIDYQQGRYALLPSKLQVPAVPPGKEHILSLFIGSQFLVLTPLERQAGTAINNILSGMSEDEQIFLRNLTSRICLAPVGEFCDPNILIAVYQAVSQCQAIKISYYSFSQNCEFESHVNPYGIYIKERSEAYLVGYVTEKPDKLGRFKLSRIRKLTVLNFQFHYPENFSIWDEMKKGFWSGDGKYEVVLKFVPAAAQLVKEREPAERIEAQPDGSLLVRRSIRNLKEVHWEILGYEANVEVLQPEELREMVKHSIEKMRQIYQHGLDLHKRI